MKNQNHTLKKNRLENILLLRHKGKTYTCDTIRKEWQWSMWKNKQW